MYLGNDATLADLVMSVRSNLTMLNKHMSKANNDKPVGSMKPAAAAHPAMSGFGAMFGGMPPWAFGGGMYPGHPGILSSTHSHHHIWTPYLS